MSDLANIRSVSSDIAAEVLRQHFGLVAMNEAASIITVPFELDVVGQAQEDLWLARGARKRAQRQVQKSGLE